MYTKYVIVAIVFLSCALVASGAVCDRDAQMKKLDECRQLYNTATSGGADLSCSDVPRIDECFEQMKSVCNTTDLIEETYMKVQMMKGICDNIDSSGAPRPSIGFVLIAVTLMSILLTVNRY